jgi:transcriptional regulator with XRE-family HTH domain
MLDNEYSFINKWRHKMREEIRHTNQELIEFIRKRREELGLTQAELAKRAGIGQPYISKIESGAIRSPSHATIQALSLALGMGSDGLMDETWCIPGYAEIGYCPNFKCPGSNYAEIMSASYWKPYKTSLEDEEGRIEFCVYCGTKLLTECENCGRKIKQFYQHCPGCGHYLLRPSPGAPEEENEAGDDDVPL